MGKTRNFNIVNNRIQFKCPSCGARRNSALPPNLRRKNIRCHKCNEIVRCMFNRRSKPRTPHLGKVQMITRDDKSLDVNLRDISPEGIGIEMPLSSFRSRKIALGHQVRFKCRWNSRLLDTGYFIVTNIRNQQIGLKKV
ncbi:MAG: PilZ domain-containing protein [Deltaproteobacteria bacterium]|nr:PilZ domain-containing protein [Deltaproteobacteria bacterium]MBW2659702.1 PilZ domain-containing protein [Deltaproteobacteria bacterium]